VSHVAIVLPGASYGPDMPGLAIPIAVLRGRGATVTAVEYPGGDWPDWRRAEAGDWSEIIEALAPQIEPALGGATRVTLVAKSMGTSVFGGLTSLFPKTTEAIWITPLFHDPDVRRHVIDAGFRCLSVVGTADPAHDPEGQAKVTGACAGGELALDGVGHRLVMSDKQAETLRAAVEEFL
jgi:hypothetical protein